MNAHLDELPDQRTPEGPVWAGEKEVVLVLSEGFLKKIVNTDYTARG